MRACSCCPWHIGLAARIPPSASYPSLIPRRLANRRKRPYHTNINGYELSVALCKSLRKCSDCPCTWHIPLLHNLLYYLMFKPHLCEESCFTPCKCQSGPCYSPKRVWKGAHLIVLVSVFAGAFHIPIGLILVFISCYRQAEHPIPQICPVRHQVGQGFKLIKVGLSSIKPRGLREHTYKEVDLARLLH